MPERREADKEGVEDDPAGPDVHLLAVTIALVPFNHSGPAGESMLEFTLHEIDLNDQLKAKPR